MISLWKIIRNLSAIGGFGLLFCTVSTSDFYILELGQAEPSWIGRNLVIGIIMLLPMLVHVIVETYMEGRQDDVQDR